MLQLGPIGLFFTVNQSTRALEPYPILFLKDCNHAGVHMTCFSHHRGLANLEVCARRLHKLVRDRPPLSLN